MYLLKLIIKYTLLTILLFTISACGEPRTSVHDLNLPFARYEPDPSKESIGIGASIEFFNETDKAVDTYGHLKVHFSYSLLEEHGFTRDDRILFEIKGTDITGLVSERIRGNLTDLPQEILKTIHDKKSLILLLHLSEDQVAEIDLIYRTPSIPST